MGYENALILSGGKGTRLGRIGEILPKCLVPVFDQPLLVRQIEQCRRAGARRVFVSVSRSAYPLLQATLDPLTRLTGALEVTCIVEDAPLGPCGGFLACHDRIGDGGLIVVVGDVYIEDDACFDAFAAAPTHDVMVGVIPTSDPRHIECNVQVDPASGRVVAVIDKPTPDQLRGELRWCGPFALAPGVFGRCTAIALAGRTLLGTMLDAFRAAGLTLGVVEMRERALNLNTVEDVLLASLIEARRHIAHTRPGSPLTADLERVIEGLGR